MKKIIKLLNAIQESMMWLAGLMIVVMSFTTFANVVLRYFFSSPISWAFDLSGWLTGLSVFLVGGYVLKHKEHIAVDILSKNYGRKQKVFVNGLMYVLIILTATVLVYIGAKQVIKQYSHGSVANTGLNIAIWIKWLMVPVGGVLLMLQAFVSAYLEFNQVIETSNNQEQ